MYDPLTGLARFGTRDYDPVPGRWTAKDVIGFAGSDTNLYRYVNNNPVNYVDSSGQNFWDNANGFLNGLGEYTAEDNMLAIFQGLFGPAGIALYKGLDFLFDIDEPQIGDLPASTF